MATIKPFLDKRKSNKQGNYPIAFLICIGRKTTSRSSKIFIPEDMWEESNACIKKSHPLSAKFNKELTAKYDALYQEFILQLSPTISATAAPLQSSKQTSNPICIHAFAHTLIDKLRSANKIGNAWVYQYTLTSLKKYDSNTKLTFEQVDYNYLTAYQAYLEAAELKHNTIYLYLRTIRIFFNKAIKAKLIDRSIYPFYDFTIKPGKTPKRAVDITIIKQIKSLKLKPNTSLWHSRNRFMLIFYLIGISFIDLALLRPSNLKHGRITYKRRKTARWYDIKVHPAAMAIIDHYANRTFKYLLPIASELELSEERFVSIIKQENKNTNDHLAKMLDMLSIDGKVTTYTARHSWATIAKRLGYSNELIAEALGHEYGNRTTAIYLDSFEQSVIDDVNANVISSVINTKGPS